MAANSFFDEQTEQSEIKAMIVSKYFSAWANVIIGTQNRYGKGNRIGYIDLFAGPGRYKDGSKSTPLLILEQAIKDDRIRERIVTIFNDKDSDSSHSLQEAIAALPDIDTLRYKPRVENDEIGDRIVKQFEEMKMIPTFLFVDPWGYKGLSLRLVNSVVKDWGSDCVFFFNYNRINMGINNNAVKEHIVALFGDGATDRIRELLREIEDPYKREMLVVEELCEAIRCSGPRYVLPFGFVNSDGNRTSHHLFFVCKDFKGYDIMKSIMANASSDSTDGVATFQYNPADYLEKQQGLLFELSRPLEDLQDMLLAEYSGQTINFKTLYEQHSVNRPFIEKNYRSVLLEMEKENKVIIEPGYGKKRRAGTLAKHVMLTFP
ncbi:MAG: three-Cys-motif partner protein TcmP [Pirellulales bacterium]|nr:three-Cys-motif partner protein TcmP [Pirellulales bacterium]